MTSSQCSPCTTGELHDILGRYGALLQEVDRWFAGCLERHGEHLSCRNGCAECCRGLFDITLLDALLLQQGVGLLPVSVQEQVVDKARRRLGNLHGANPWFGPPWLLNGVPEVHWDEMMPEDDETPCVLLSGSGSCLVYEYRPMTCRLNGIPLIDGDGEELFDEWCTLNFTTVDPRSLVDIRFTFKDLFAQELLIFRELSRRLLGVPLNELDTLIPAALVLDLAGLRTAVTAYGLVPSLSP